MVEWWLAQGELLCRSFQFFLCGFSFRELQLFHFYGQRLALFKRAASFGLSHNSNHYGIFCPIESLTMRCTQQTPRLTALLSGPFTGHPHHALASLPGCLRVSLGR